MRRSRPERRFERQPPTGDPPRRRGTSLQGNLYVVTQELAILKREVRCFSNVRGAPYREIRRRSSSYYEVTQTSYVYKPKREGPSGNQPPFGRSFYRKPQTHGDGPHAAKGPYEHATTRGKPQDSGDGQHASKSPRYSTTTQPGNEQEAPKDSSYQDKYRGTPGMGLRFGIARRIIKCFQLKTAQMQRGWQTERLQPSSSIKELPENVPASARSYYKSKEETSSWVVMDMPVLCPNVYKKTYNHGDKASSGSEAEFEFRAELDLEAEFHTGETNDDDSFSSISTASFVSISDLDTVDSDDFKSHELRQSRAIGPEFYYKRPKKALGERSLNIYEEQDRVKAAYQASVKTPRKPIEFVEPPCVARPRDTKPDDTKPVDTKPDTSRGAIKKVGLQYFHQIPPPPEDAAKLAKKRKKYLKSTEDCEKILPGGPPVVIGDVVKRFFSTTTLLKDNIVQVAKAEPQQVKARSALSEPSLTLIRKPELPISFPYTLETLSEANSHPFDFKSYMGREPNTRLVCKKLNDELIIYAIDHSNLGKNIFKAFELESYLLFPVDKLPRTFPFDLSKVMSGIVPPNSTWQVLDHELVITSIYIFHRYSDLFPKNLYLLIADNLFTTVDGMLQFFEKDYVQLQEIHACMRMRPRSRAQREEQLDTLRLEAITKESLAMSRGDRVEMRNDDELQTMECRRKQKQYIERLKPPCRIAPLPPRPRKWVPRLKSPEPVKKPPPPSTADLAYLQMCYELHGCPKVVSAPRINTPIHRAESTRPTVSIPPPARTGHRRRDFIRATRRRTESPSKGNHLDPDED